MEARYEEPTLHGLASFPGPTWPGNEAMQGCASLPIPKVRVPLDSSLEGSGDIGLIPGGVWGHWTHSWRGLGTLDSSLEGSGDIGLNPGGVWGHWTHPWRGLGTLASSLEGSGDSAI